MYKDDPTKTWVDVEKYESVSFFVKGGPQPGQANATATPSDSLCVPFFGLPCCYITQIPAKICNLNPSLKNNSNSELGMDFIKTELKSNMTVLIDKQFNVSLTYQQSFFPVFFGFQVYSGYEMDGNVTCKDFTF